MVQRRTFLGLVAGGTTAALAGCTGQDNSGEGSVVDETLTLTTTTSTYDTGLLDEVNSAFTDVFGAEVDAVAQGTGAALETARNGDSDIV
ncbi:MAG: tungstate transport system substrate-binding protein, partial [Natronomonas sp.]